MQIRCLGNVEVGWSQCDDPDMVPFMSPAALQDIHFLLFTLAVVHIITCVICFVLAGLRVSCRKAPCATTILL